MTNYALLTSAPISDAIAYATVFILGVFIKSKVNWGKTNSDVVDTLTKDYRAMKALYDAKADEVRRKNEQLLHQGREVLELRARIRSYENFLQSRPPEADKILLQLEPLLKGIANKVGFIYKDGVLTGHPAAHSQAKEYGAELPNI